ncbi:hypothetical protein XH93_36825 [Bradyrhizobium sp. CCBAU 51753]|nr:hypothetical protein XH93_36825 [Bradyrhizobium sp. CCBAU 51753]
MVRIITMRRPEKKNTLTQDMYLAMSGAIESAQRNPAIRCLILTGQSGVFTPGNDRRPSAGRDRDERDGAARELARRLHELSYERKEHVSGAISGALGPLRATKTQ